MGEAYNTMRETNVLYFFGPEECSELGYINGNRDIKMSTVRKFVNDLKEGDAEFFPPISVDISTNCVADGQHRLEAFKMWWKETGATTPISVIYKDFGDKYHLIKRVRKMNAGMHNWSTNDHAKSMLEYGDKAVALINEFCLDDKHPMMHRVNKATKKKTPTLRYASALLLGRSITNDIKRGKVEIPKNALEEGENAYAEISAILDVLGFKTRTGGWLEHVLTAWHNVRNDRMYKERIDMIGMENVLKAVDIEIERTTDGATREWEDKFRNAIYHASKEFKKVIA